MKAGDVLEETVAYFGPAGLGLQVTKRTLTSVRLEGGGGFVQVQVRVGEPEPGTTDVDLVLDEWEQHALLFMKKIKQ